MRPSLANVARQWFGRIQNDGTRRRPPTTVHLVLENLENRELLSWTPYTNWDPTDAVKAVRVGVDPGTGSFIPYAIGLNNYVYRVPAGTNPQLLTPGQVSSISPNRLLVDGGDGNLYSYIFVVRMDDSNIYYTRASANGMWSPVYNAWAPGVQVKSVDVGYDAVNGGFAVYAIGLDDQVYRVDQNATHGQLLTGGKVKAIAAAQLPQIANQAWVFVIGLNNLPYITEGDSSGNWQAYGAPWNSSLTVSALSVGVAPGISGNEIALYGVGLTDQQVYSIPSQTPVNNPITPGQVLGLAADQIGETDNSAYVFVVGLNSLIYYTLAFSASPGSSSRGLVPAVNEQRTGDVAGLTDQVSALFLGDSQDGLSWNRDRKRNSGRTQPGRLYAGRDLEALVQPLVAVSALDNILYDLN